jgi:hypothetical protein
MRISRGCGFQCGGMFPLSSAVVCFFFFLNNYLFYRFENIGGTCTLKTCLTRNVNFTAAQVCGSADCVFDGTSCNTQCGPYSEVGDRGCVVSLLLLFLFYYIYIYIYHFIVDYFVFVVLLMGFNIYMYRVCTAPAAVCDGRAVQSVPINKCGDECTYDPVTDKCVNQCIFPYIRNVTSGACQLGTCSQLLPNLYVFFFFFCCCCCMYIYVYICCYFQDTWLRCVWSKLLCQWSLVC